MSAARTLLRAALRHVDTGIELDLATNRRNEIGRKDPQEVRNLDLDLSSLDPERNISRQHAVIENTDDGWVLVEEKGSINGTFLNQQQLRRGVRYPIQPGDKIRLATIDFELIVEQR